MVIHMDGMSLGGTRANLVIALLLVAALAGLASAQGVNISAVDNQTVNVTNATADALSSALTARLDIVTLGYLKTVAAMNGTIGFFGEKDTSVLVSLRDNFTALYGGLSAFVGANDPSGFGKQVAEMHKAAAQFKRETAKLADPGQVGELKRLLQNSTRNVTESDSYVFIEERMIGKKKEAYAKICVFNIGRIQDFIGSAKERNVSVSDLEGRLAEVREKCAQVNVSVDGNLSAGIESELRLRVEECGMNESAIASRIEAQLSVRNITLDDDLKERISDAAGKAVDKCRGGATFDDELTKRVQGIVRGAQNAADKEKNGRLSERFEAAQGELSVKAKEISEKGLAKAISVISALENRGVNVSQVREKLEVVQAYKAAVQAACANRTSVECREAVKNFTEVIGTIGEQIQVISSSNVSKERIERVRESIGQANKSGGNGSARSSNGGVD